MLKLIRAYLNAGVMADGVLIERVEGTPQGPPLSPLLANIMVDDFDREMDQLQARLGHSSVTMTQDQYGHLMEGLCAEVAQRREQMRRTAWRRPGQGFGGLDIRHGRDERPADLR